MFVIRNSRSILFTIAALLCLYVTLPSTAFAQTNVAGATVELWNDTNGDGAFGGASDTLIDSTTTDALGAYALDADGLCAGCAVVITGWHPGADDIDLVGGTAIADAELVGTRSATLWADDDGDGVAGSAGDSIISSDTLGAADDYRVMQADCSACAVVIINWHPGADDIDTIIGVVTTWQPGVDDIDWVPGGDDIDWVPGGDDIDWVPGGDDIDWVPGGDDIDWVPGGDDIDWVPGGDDIDWVPGGDDIDWVPGGDDIDEGGARS